jgi:radical SAM superfamily enzyme YgiQ (UPF0313 family)
MYRSKSFRVRSLDDSVADIEQAGAAFGHEVRKVFVADGDALVMETGHWMALLHKLRATFPHLRRVSSYATASNVLDKSEEELKALSDNGLKLLYIGPESGDPVTLKRIVKGGTAEEHIEAAQRAHAAGMKTSVIILLGAGGVERSREHALRSAELVTGMDPAFLSALTLTVIPNTPLARMEAKGKFRLPDIHALLGELRLLVAHAAPTDTIFRTNHASNYLPLAGRLPRDRDRILAVLDEALAGRIPLRPEGSRGL